MIFFDNDSRDAAFYFSVEELFTRYIRSDMTVFMLWQTDKTVMIGNNQVVDAEVDMRFAADAGIKLVRRSSGGGAIFTDPGTVLYTFIEPLTMDAKAHMEKAAKMVIEAIRKMGVPAAREGRNDILSDGRKISGLAQYTVGAHICTHGSLLYDADLETLTRVLVANENKLRPKGIASIRSRVRNIKPYIADDHSVSEFMGFLKKEIYCDKAGPYELTADDATQIGRICKEKYANPAWNLVSHF